jgi:hypothetical protein
MNKRLYIPTAIFLVAFLLAGCSFQIVSGSGKVVTVDRPVEAFSRITLAGIGDVIVTQGPATPVRIEAEDNLIEYFDTSVQGDTLTIGIKDQYMGITLQPTRPIKFYVSTPDIEALTLAGSGSISAPAVTSTDFKVALLGSGNISIDAIDAASLDVRLAGSGDIDLGTVTVPTVTQNISGSGNIHLATLTATKVSSTIAGSGDVQVTGTVSEQNIEILGSGSYLAIGLKSQSATVRTSGSGDSRLAVSDSLDVTILGSGDVTYTGTPHVNASVAGSGKINQADQ